jgi:hypothetical protein
MRRRSYELLFALAAILLVTVWYLVQAREGIPRPSSRVGYALGILGFLLMLCTEILYSLRKRLPRFTRGPMRTWLQAHVVTGLLGSCLVLLHSGWRFHGLAGVVALLTLIVVVSGFVGRYLYTVVPRTLDGAEVAVQGLKDQIARVDRQLQTHGYDRAGAKTWAQITSHPRRGWGLLLWRPWRRRQQKRAARLAMQQLEVLPAKATARLRELLEERLHLHRQIETLAATRYRLALWHVFHVPLAGVLLALAFVHAAGAWYYSASLK